LSVRRCSTSGSSICCITSQRPSELRYEYRIIGLCCIHYLTNGGTTRQLAPQPYLAAAQLPFTPDTTRTLSSAPTVFLSWLGCLGELPGLCRKPSSVSSSSILLTPYGSLRPTLFLFSVTTSYLTGYWPFDILPYLPYLVAVAAGLAASFDSLHPHTSISTSRHPSRRCIRPLTHLDLSPCLGGSRLTVHPRRTPAWLLSSCDYFTFFHFRPLLVLPYSTPYLLGHVCQSTGQCLSAWSFCNSSLDIPSFDRLASERPWPSYSRTATDPTHFLSRQRSRIPPSSTPLGGGVPSQQSSSLILPDHPLFMA
jgi:hypothetical protein